MKRYKIAVIPGDGIGPEVIKEGKKVLESVCDRLEFIEYPYGGTHYLRTGEILPEHALEEFKKMSAIYLGAVGHPKVKPGIIETGLLLKIRFFFEQFVNLRPVKLFEGAPCPIAGKTHKDINFYVVRENTEDFYIGVGGRVRRRSNETAFQLGMITRKGCERVMKYAFELAKNKNMKRVTSCDKANVLVYMYGLWREVFEEVGKNYPDIEKEYAYVDALAQWFIIKPEWYKVVVVPNMFGDIITDLSAVLQGGMGMAPGANIGNSVSMFEPIHGSAPDIAGKGRANPIACILAGSLLLEHLGMKKEAKVVEKAVADVLKNKTKTPDLGGSSSTSQVGDKIAKRVEELKN